MHSGDNAAMPRQALACWRAPYLTMTRTLPAQYVTCFTPVPSFCGRFALWCPTAAVVPEHDRNEEHGLHLTPDTSPPISVVETLWGPLVHFRRIRSTYRATVLSNSQELERYAAAPIARTAAAHLRAY